MKCLMYFREKKNKNSKLWLRLSGSKKKMYRALECIAEITQDVSEEK